MRSLILLLLPNREPRGELKVLGWCVVSGMLDTEEERNEDGMLLCNVNEENAFQNPVEVWDV